MAGGHASSGDRDTVEGYTCDGIERRELGSELRINEPDRPFIRWSCETRAPRFETLMRNGGAR